MAKKDSQATVNALRFADVFLDMNYPIVSAYEFEHLQMEDIIRERWDASTIYFIVQRPLTYFDNVVCEGHYIKFDIADGQNPPMPCSIDLDAAGIINPDDKFDIKIGFYSKKTSSVQPFRNVAGFKLYRENGEFILWWSPLKLLYEKLVKGLKVNIAAGFNPYSFLDFKVHYIGKSFSQKIWERLSNHKKMKRILTLEPEIGRAAEARTQHELSIVILQITGVDDRPVLDFAEKYDLADPHFIFHTLNDDDESLNYFFTTPPIQIKDEAITTEVEAYLINRFKPSYNDTLFNNYPNITGGLRTKGYSQTSVSFQTVPASFYTEHLPLVCED